MADNTRVEQPERKSPLQKKSSRTTGRPREIEHLTTPPPGASTTTSSRETSRLSVMAGLPESKSERFSALTHGDRRSRLDGPPPLPFNLRDHKLSITIFTLLGLVECCFIPIGLYYGLTYGTNMRS
ncbi:hypothetical protein LTR40_013820, partial [Exophiala xenobiotica]